MNRRIAVFISKKELEDYFGFTIDPSTPVDPHYNIAPSYIIPVLTRDVSADKLQLYYARWGLGSGSSTNPVIDSKKALSGLESGKYERCIIPISGFYTWKEKGKRSRNPFFVRMLTQPLMAVSGVAEAGGKQQADLSCAMIETDANALIQPLDPKMPLQLSAELSTEWLNSESDASGVLEKGARQFLLTDMTVLRVSSKVNDLQENSPKLIQPLPK